MKLQVGRVYVLIDQSGTTFDFEEYESRLVKVLGFYHTNKGEIMCKLQGFYDGVYIIQEEAPFSQLRIASEKQRSSYNRTYSILRKLGQFDA